MAIFVPGLSEAEKIVAVRGIWGDICPDKMYYDISMLSGEELFEAAKELEHYFWPEPPPRGSLVAPVLAHGGVPKYLEVRFPKKLPAEVQVFGKLCPLIQVRAEPIVTPREFYTVKVPPLVKAGNGNMNFAPFPAREGRTDQLMAFLQVSSIPHVSRT